jgi:thiol-disulfide isomerase/thioredoxin/outer membrane lipoprotein-sorting protein
MGIAPLCVLLAFQLTAFQGSAEDVLRSARNAIIGAQSAGYVVTKDYADSSGNKHKGHTNIVIVKSPFEFRAEHRREDGSRSETAISDGKTTNTITDGKRDQSPTFGPKGPDWSMNVVGDADSDVAATWHLILDADYFQRAFESGRILYLWEEEVQGDPCSVIVYARDHWTDYLWISTKTGFPRATQRVSMTRGPTRLSSRYEISDIRLNPQLRTDAFLLPTDGTGPSETTPSRPKMQQSASGAVASNVVGVRLPDLELRDPQFKASLLSDLRGKPLLITFWAAWCSPCREELAALDRVQNDSQVQFQIVAIGVQDRQANALDFIKGHKQYRFLYLTDPDMERDVSPLTSFFGIVGIPVTVLADSSGQIVNAWVGYDGESDLRLKLTKVVYR